MLPYHQFSRSVFAVVVVGTLFTKDGSSILTALLLSYLTSEEVAKVIGDNNADNIVPFLRSHVFVHEQHFARCFYLDVRGFDAYSNTCLEGTNYGVKYCENRVLPKMSQAKAIKVMINQDEDKFTQNWKKTLDAFHKKPLQARTNNPEQSPPTCMVSKASRKTKHIKQSKY